MKAGGDTRDTMIELLTEEGAEQLQTKTRRCDRCSRDLPATAANDICSFCSQTMAFKDGEQEIQGMKSIYTWIHEHVHPIAVQNWMGSEFKVRL